MGESLVEREVLMIRVTFDIRLKVVYTVNSLEAYPEGVSTLEEIAAFEKSQVENGSLSLSDMEDFSEFTELNVSAEDVGSEDK